VYPHTVALALAGLAFAIVMALPLGIYAALRRGTWFDTLARSARCRASRSPTCCSGRCCCCCSSSISAGCPGPGETGGAALVLPAFAIGTHLMAMLARMTRSSMVEVLGEDYLRTARAKGLSERVVVWKHALRNAIMPVVTVAGLQFGSVLSGSIIIENIFARPGLGSSCSPRSASATTPSCRAACW
jgi:ABC-type dipeptide/oligopeptide/nickel transport system permease component